ncbi:MAG TPA: nucleotidyltransferase family protein [Gaiellaceae bacterium]
MTDGTSRFPNPVQTEFLRTCLLGGAVGREALAAWLAKAGDGIAGLRRAEQADKNLFALFQHARQGDGSPAPFRAILRAAAAHEELRVEAIGAAAAETLELLEEAGVETLVVGGAALAWGYYPDPSLRHCHDIDLLVAEPGRAREALAGFETLSTDRSTRLRHPSGTLIGLHPTLYRERWRREPADLDGCSMPIAIAGRAGRALGAADLVVATSANAFAAASPGLRFLADVWFLIGSEKVDWDRVTAHAVGSKRAVPTSLVLGWLAEHTDAGVPAAVLARLDRARIGETAVELAVGGVRRARGLVRRFPARIPRP